MMLEVPGPGEIGCRPERPPTVSRHRQFSLYTYGIVYGASMPDGKQCGGPGPGAALFTLLSALHYNTFPQLRRP